MTDEKNRVKSLTDELTDDELKAVTGGDVTSANVVGYTFNGCSAASGGGIYCTVNGGDLQSDHKLAISASQTILTTQPLGE